VKTTFFEFPLDFVEFIEFFNTEKVEYVVIGGLAVGFHGHVRATKDMDVFVNPTPANAKRVFRALKAFGAPARFGRRRIA
jgi:hypothetical protein